MRKFTLPLLLLLSSLLFSQENTDVFVFDISPSYGGLELMNIQNISNDKGYNNQPSFITDETLVFAGNNKGQTDIGQYDIPTKSKTWVNQETEGSEYSPQKFPLNSNLAAVRLDKDGTQRLYKYSTKTGTATELIPNLEVAYFSFYNSDKIFATVLNNASLDLTLIDLPSKSVDTLFQNAGRTLQRIPKTDSMSYSLVNEQGNLDLYVMDINSKESFFICELPVGVQDYVWINDTQILIGMGSTLYIYDTLGEPEWKKVASLEEYGIKNITRMAISPNGKKLALVAEAH